MAYKFNPFSGTFDEVNSGDVVGPASATDNAIARYDGTTGKLIQDTGVLIDDSNHVVAPNNAFFKGRNAANTADVSLLGIDGSDNIYLGAGSGQNIRVRAANFIPDSTANLGAGAAPWANAYFTNLGSSIQWNTNTANVRTAAGTSSFPIAIYTGDASGAGLFSGAITIRSGTATGTANSGDVSIGPGGVSSGTVGALRLRLPTEGTAGHILVSTDTTGASAWAAASSVFTDLLDRNETAVIWTDGTGTYADFVTALADTDVDVFYFMPNQSGVFHVIDNSAGPISITRPILLYGLGTEGFVDIRGSTLANDLFSVTGAGALAIQNISIANCDTAIVSTGTGRVTIRSCEFDGIIGCTTALSMANAAADAVVQDTLFLFTANTLIFTDCDTATVTGNTFILNSGTCIQVDDCTTNVNINSNNFLGGAIQLDINGGVEIISRSNTYDFVGAGSAIDINAPSGSFDSVGDLIQGGTAHITVNASNAMTYRFRNGAFDASKFTIPSGQRKPTSFTDINAGLYSNTLKVYTDSSNDASVTIATNSNSLGAILSGAGAKNYTLNPSAGQATSIGAITAASGKTGTINISGAKGGLNFGNVDLSGASSITGTIQDSGTYNTNLGTIESSTAVNGLIDFQGKYNVNTGNILNGGTLTFGTAASGMVFQGLVSSGGVVTCNGLGAAIGSVAGSNCTLLAGTTNNFGFTVGSVAGATGTTNSVENQGRGAMTVATVNTVDASASGGTVSGTSFFKNNSGSGNFLGGYSGWSDLTGGTSVVNHQATSSGIGTFTWVAMNGQTADGFGTSSSNITITNSGNGSILAGQAITLGAGSGSASMVSSQNGSVCLGRAVDGSLIASGAASFIAAACSNGTSVTASNTGSSAIGSAAVFNMTSSGLGTSARGYANTAAIVASAANARQQGPGTNAQADSSQFGIAGSGIRLLHTSSVTTPQRGDIRNDGTYVGIFSNGREISLFGHIQTLSSQASSTGTGNVGTGVDTLMTYSVPANTLTVNNDSIRGEAYGIFAANANLKQLRVVYGSTELATTGAVVINGGTFHAEWTVTRTGATAQVAFARITVRDAAGVQTIYQSYTTPSETLSGAVSTSLTGEATSNDDISQKRMLITRERAT